MTVALAHLWVEDDVSHYLLSCSKFTSMRTNMVNRLNNLNITSINCKTLLGGADVEINDKFRVLEVVGKFLVDSGRLSSL